MKKIHILWLVIVCLLFSGCVEEKIEEENSYWIYHVNYKKSGLEKTELELEEGQEKLHVTQMAEMIFDKDSLEISILPTDVELLGYSMVGDVLKLNFNSNYRKITFTDEILCRAAIVKNFVQVPGVNYVQFYIEEEELQDASGNPVGLLRGSSFIEFSGENLGDIQSKKLLLYFANESGDALISETRTVYFSSSAPVEKVVVEQLIQGPKKSGHYATLPSGTGIIGVSMANGIVYVNLDQKALGESITVDSAVSVYSIVNSVLSAGNANKVQISINGDTKVTFKETVDLNQVFEFNFMLLEGADAEDAERRAIPHITDEVEDE